MNAINAINACSELHVYVLELLHFVWYIVNWLMKWSLQVGGTTGLLSERREWFPVSYATLWQIRM